MVGTSSQPFVRGPQAVSPISQREFRSQRKLAHAGRVWRDRGENGDSEITIIKRAGLCATSVDELSNAPVADADARTLTR
eukprot:4153838-Prymnesium_polylepis.1